MKHARSTHHAPLLTHAPRRRWVRPMASRDPHELHRVSTPLELLFDLCFVVAISQAAARLHHSLAEGHFVHALLSYATTFFAIWWAWVNFTWFASAYDTDDVPYRWKVFVQIAGVLVLAAGIPRAFDRGDNTIVTLGYAIMRTGLVAHWLRAFRADVERRRTALRYVIGVTSCQVGWICLLAVSGNLRLIGWLFLATAEMLVPVWAEKAGPTSWHRHHIAERYGLLTLIVLGESMLSATVAIQSALDTGHLSPALVGVIVGGLFTTFSMWWIYFDRPAHEPLQDTASAFAWSYGHLFLFAAIAAVGAGLSVAVDGVTGHSEITTTAAGLVIATPVALFVFMVWLLLIRPLHRHGIATPAFLAAVVGVLASPLSPWPLVPIGFIMAGLTTVSVSLREQ